LEKNLIILKDNLSDLNAKFKIISGKHIVDIKTEIYKLYSRNKISREIYRYVSKYYQFDIEKSNSMYYIIIAIPQRSTVVTFNMNGKKIDTIIPPTYIYKKYQEKIFKILLKSFGKKSKINFAYLPKKLIAVRSGLAKYGKNNITYVDGMGSFHRLELFFIDYPFDIDDWQEEKMMRACNGCLLCTKICPNNCIREHDFVIKAEKCLTYLNENAGKFPDWVSIKSHNALVGCMKCQIVCPVNRNYIKNNDKGISFSEKETEIIIKVLKDDPINSNVIEKLKYIDMFEYISILPRNISVLIK
jgi:epoxyqueuosine reductase